MWFWLAIAALLCWSGSDLFSKIGCRDGKDKYSHLKMVMAVGVVMGLHACYEVFVNGVEINFHILATYLPVSLLYILSMAMGYLGLRYIELSISSPICNASGALVAITAILTMGESYPPAVLIAIGLVCLGVIGLGAIGVGIATAGSQYVAAGLTLLYMSKTKTSLRLAGFKVYRQKLMRMITIGLPAGLQGCMFSLSNVIIQSAVNAYPTVTIAGNTAAGNLEGFVYTAMNSVYQAAVTFVGQNVGAGKFERIKKISFQCAGMVLVIGLTLSGIRVFYGDKLLLIYASGENRDLIVQAGVQRLQIIAATYFLCGLMDVGCGILRGMGKAVQPMIVSLLGSCVFRIIWVFTVCPLFPGQIMALYISYPISWIVTLTLQMIFSPFFFGPITNGRTV